MSTEGTRSRFRIEAMWLALVAGVALGGCGSGDGRNIFEGECEVGSADCGCTAGGGCDPGLECSANMCREPSPDADDDGGGGNGDGNARPKLDTPDGDTGDTGDDCAQSGCKRVDMLFAIDSSLSMGEEIDALTASKAFSTIIEDLADLNCGTDFRIGLTNDNDGGWLAPTGKDWWDSTADDALLIGQQFAGSASALLGNGGTPAGCEHVLTSATDLLAADTTGFLRDDALLVLVFVTDVDDYGFYDLTSFGGLCSSLGCPVTPTPVKDLYDTIVAQKGGDASAVATIIVSGDDMVPEGMNTCGQPAACCGGGIECGQAFLAPRLHEFAGLVGQNGVTGDICVGAANVPMTIQTALETNIDLACQEYVPPG